MSYCSGKGYRAEHAVELTLASLGEQTCYRPRSGNHRDLGDIGNVPMVISVKDHARPALAEWCDDLARMVDRSERLTTGVVWHKRSGRADPLNWYVTTTGKLFIPMYLAYAKLEQVAT